MEASEVFPTELMAKKSDESGLGGDLSASVSPRLYFLFLASTVIQENCVGINSNRESPSGSPGRPQQFSL